MWTYEDFENLIENITVRRKLKDGVHTLTQLLPHENYKLRLVNDEGYTDNEGNYVKPTYHEQLFTSPNNEKIIFAQYVAVKEESEELTEIEEKAKAYDILTGGAE